jgi:hypothetical protein
MIQGAELADNVIYEQFEAGGPIRRGKVQMLLRSSHVFHVNDKQPFLVHVVVGVAGGEIGDGCSV